MKKKINLSLLTIFFCLFSINYSQANFQEQLINKYKTINTLSFNFKQKIAEKEEVGSCVIKYPLLMKCDYENFKQKSVISNGETVVVIKKNIRKFIIIL